MIVGHWKIVSEKFKEATTTKQSIYDLAVETKKINNEQIDACNHIR